MITRRADIDSPDPPQVFANKVIRQMVDHMLEGRSMEKKDYLSIRTVFRSCKGSWQEIIDGNIKHLKLLADVVVGWGAASPAPEEDEEFI